MNFAKRDGTIYVGDGSGTFTFTNVNFTNNTAETGSGSGIFVPQTTSNSNDKIILNNCNFINNFANKTGTIYFNGEILSSTNVDFLNNIAQYGHGSVIYMPGVSRMIYDMFCVWWGKK